MEKAIAYLEEQAEIFPGAAGLLSGLRDALQRRLYFQYSEKLGELLRIPFFLANDTLHRLYQNAVRPIEQLLDPLCLARFVSAAVERVDARQSEETLSGAMQTALKCPEARFLLAVALFKSTFAAKHKAESYAALAALKKSLFALDDAACARELRLAELRFHKFCGDLAGFRAAAHEYAKSADLAAMRADDRRALAEDLVAAALLDADYDLGALAAHPVLDALCDSPWGEFREALAKMQIGDVSFFELFLESKGSFLSAEKKARMMQKAREISFMRLCAAAMCGRKGRLGLGEVSAAVKMAAEGVELMAVDLICAGLVEGKLDGCAKEIVLKGVRPRALLCADVASLKGRLQVCAQDLESGRMD